uniref:Putative secreted peptide n=1 Tax=Anopheles braziliensis TaxID=58242 RepID=A0A2M3ZNR3_9DIPT
MLLTVLFLLQLKLLLIVLVLLGQFGRIFSRRRFLLELTRYVQRGGEEVEHIVIVSQTTGGRRQTEVAGLW